MKGPPLGKFSLGATRQGCGKIGLRICLCLAAGDFIGANEDPNPGGPNITELSASPTEGRSVSSRLPSIPRLF